MEVTRNTLPTRRLIVESNVEIHRIESPVYDLIHKEIFNKFEQRRLWGIVRKLSDYSKEPKWCLDVGCGTGNLTLKLAYLNANGYTVGLDISAHMLLMFKHKISKLRSINNVDLVLADAQVLPFRKAVFKIAGYYSVLHHIPDPYSALLEAHRVLLKEGALFIDHEPNSSKTRMLAGLIYTFYLMTRLGRSSYRRHVIVDHSVSDFWAEKGFEKPVLSGFLASCGFEKINFDYHFLYAFALMPRPFSTFSIIFDWLDKLPIVKKFANCITVVAFKSERPKLHNK